MALATRWLSSIRTLIPGSAFSGLTTPQRAQQMRLAAGAAREVASWERYAVLRWYYQNNGLYDRLAAAFYQSGRQIAAVKGLRNPAYRIVEFYPALLWPGDLPAALPLQLPATTNQTQAESLTAAIHQVWQWSNWAQAKQDFARWLPMLGDTFIKVCQPPDSQRVYFQMIDPANVIDFDEDARGNLTYVRMAMLQEDRTTNPPTWWTHIEEWSQADQVYRRWYLSDAVLAQTPDAYVKLTPDETVPFSQFGIDFIPLVHCKFLNAGELRGVGAFMLQLDKIDNVNMEATRLAQLLYRYNRKIIAIASNDKDSANRPGAGLALADQTVTDDDEIMMLPGTATATTLLPSVDFEAHRRWIADGIADLQGDCPELAYWRITEQAASRDLSSLAIRAMLRPALSRLHEVRGRAEDCLARADMMALTLGKAAHLPQFQQIGTYDQGDFEHTFEPRNDIPLSEKEQADTTLVEWQRAVLQAGLGVPQSQILREQGYTDEQIEKMAEEQATTGVIPTVAQ